MLVEIFGDGEFKLTENVCKLLVDTYGEPRVSSRGDMTFYTHTHSSLTIRIVVNLDLLVSVNISKGSNRLFVAIAYQTKLIMLGINGSRTDEKFTNESLPGLLESYIIRLLNSN